MKGEGTVVPLGPHTAVYTRGPRGGMGVCGEGRGASGRRRAFLENPAGIAWQQPSSLNPHANAEHGPEAVGATLGAPPPAVPACSWMGVGWGAGEGTHEHTGRVLLASVC